MISTSYACMKPQQASVFDIQGLKSEMMVTAITCGLRNDYNQVIERFRPELLQGETQARSQFRSTSSYDHYVTELANVQSKAGVEQYGDDFCHSQADMFTRLLALPDNTAFHAYAATHRPPQPAAQSICRVTPHLAESEQKTHKSNEVHRIVANQTSVNHSLRGFDPISR
jgi:hypothetical protein